MYASFMGHADIARILLAHGAHATSADKEGRTPLLEATYAGHSVIVTLLLDHGAQIEARNKYGTTALLAASVTGPRG